MTMPDAGPERRTGAADTRYTRLLVAAGAVLILFFLAVLLGFAPAVAPVGWGAFLGRFHPLVVHFPIVLALLLPLLEGLRRWRPEIVRGGLLPFFWGLTVASCAAAVWAGLMLYASESYEGALVGAHLRAGAVLGLTATGTALLFALAPIRTRRPWTHAYHAGLLLTAGLVVYTSHLGGSLTHGTGFVTDAFPGLPGPAALAATAPESMRVYDDLLRPALEARCMSCHNPHKTKGELDLTTFDGLLAGGESGRPAVVPGDPGGSELLRRATLPPGDDDRMPPDGKPALSAGALFLLEWWIAEGADPALTPSAADSTARAALQATLDRYLPDLIRSEHRRRRDRAARAETYEALQAIAAEHGLEVAPDPDTDSTLFAVSMRLPPVPVSDAAVTALLPHAESISRLSLVAADLTDDALFAVGRMQNLQRLLLPRTPIDGTGLVYLQDLPNLETLNLSHTALTDASALHLLNLPALTEVYLYATPVSPPVLEALRTHRSETAFLQEEGPNY